MSIETAYHHYEDTPYFIELIYAVLLSRRLRLNREYGELGRLARYGVYKVLFNDKSYKLTLFRFKRKSTSKEVLFLYISPAIRASFIIANAVYIWQFIQKFSRVIIQSFDIQ